MFKYAEENNGVGVVIPTDQNSDGVEIVDKMDEGCGMTRAQVNELLQGEGKTTKTAGSGIGLPSTITNINTWGGDVHIISKPGKGTEVIIALPKE